MENNFEANLKELETIVNELEKGNVSLDEAIEKYTKAMNLAKSCNDKLKEATESVNKIALDNQQLANLELTEE